MNLERPVLRLLLIGAVLLSVEPAHAIKIVVPDQYEEQIEAIKRAEQEERKKQLQGLSEDSGDRIAIQGANAEKAPPIEADEFLVQSVVEATDTAKAFDGQLEPDEGLISGQIVNKESGEPIDGVAILIEDTNIATVTDAEGRYSLGPIPAGEYNMILIKSGFIEANVTEYQVAGGEVSVFPFALPPRPAEMSDEVYELQDFTVTAEEANDLMMKLELRMESDSILEIFSSEDFSKYAASDVGEAIKRVAGITVEGGQFAVIRGLEERYSSTTFNGAPVPSPDPDRQSVPLDLFSSDIVNNIQISKTFEANMPGNSSGGTIGILTNVYPEEFTVKFSSKVGFNDNAQDEFLTPGRGDTSVSFGRARDEASPSFDPSVDGPLVYNTPTAEILNINRDRVSPKTKDAKPDTSFGLEIGGTTELFNGREFRGLITLSQKEKYRTAFGTQEKRLAMPSMNYRASRDQYSDLRYNSDGSVRVLRNTDIISSDLSQEELSYSSGKYDRTVSSFEEQTNILLSGELDIDTDGKHVIGGMYFYTKVEEEIANFLFNGEFTDTQGLTDAEVLNSRGFVPNYTPISTQFLQDASANTGLSASEVLNDARYSTSTVALVERELNVAQVSGRHSFLEDALSASWGYSSSTAEQTESDVISLTALTLPDQTIYAQLGNDSGDQFTPFVSWRNIDEEQEYYRADFSYEAKLNNEITLIVDAGGSFEDTERDSTLLSYDLILSPSGVVTTDRNEALSANLTGDAFTNPAPVTAAKGDRNIDAYYLSTKFSRGAWDLIVGTRFEDYKMSTKNEGGTSFFNSDVLLVDPSNPTNPNPVFNSQFLGVDPITTDTQSEIDEDKYLPTISLSYRPMERMKITLAASQTVARPSFKDYTYITARDPMSLDFFIGNPQLETSDVTNFDARFEYVWENGDLFAFGVFYKTIDDPVEQTKVRGSDAISDITYNNPDQAVVQGIEIEGRKSLDFLGTDFLSNFSIGGNATLIDGTVDILPAMEEIFNGGFEYTDQNGNQRTSGEGHNVANLSSDPSNPDPVFVGGPYSERELYQQPEWIINADITFDKPDWGTRATLSVFSQSDVLDSAEGFLITEGAISPSVYVASYYEINFTLSQELSMIREGLVLGFEVKNLTDSTRKLVYGDDFGGGDQDEFKIGRTYALKLSYTF